MQVLVVLARRRGQVVSRDQLIEECWAGRVVGEDAINRCIARVRRLAEAHGGFSIETIARVGHRLTEAGITATVPATTGLTQAEGPSPATADIPPTPDSPRRPKWATVLIAGAALLAVGATYVGFAHMRAQQHEQRAKTLTEIATLVGKDQYGAAFVLARPLSEKSRMRKDPAFEKLWWEIVVPMRPLISEPGATVWFKSYDDENG